MRVMSIRISRRERSRSDRIEELLDALNIYTELRAAILLGLTDEKAPNPHPRLEAAGLPIAGGAGNARMLAYAAKRLGVQHIDRETRDYVWPQLIEVGIVEPGVILKPDDVAESDMLIERGRHVPKSNNNIYLLTEEAWALLIDTSQEDWEYRLAEWLRDEAQEQRRLRLAERQAATTITDDRNLNKHAKLIVACVERLQWSIAKGFELIFTDAFDGERIQADYREKLDQAGLTPDLASKWPDAILVNWECREVHFVDAVTTDGEFDATRAQAVIAWAEEKGWRVAGLTTAYETWRAAARRQAAQRNLAVGSHLWIAEDGGKLFTVSSLG
jgi:hypothetical protein